MLNRIDLEDICRTSRVYAKLGQVHSSSLDIGIHRSRLSGLGLEYADFREYQPEDDIRYIDWRLSARSVDIYGEMKLFTKVFFSERRSDLIIAIDLSKSMVVKDKIASIIYALALILEFARRLNDRVTLILLGDKLRVYPSLKPGEALAKALNAICSGAFYDRSSLELLAQLFKKIHKRSSAMLFADYGHSLGELLSVISTARVQRIPLGIVLSVYRWEIEPPIDRGFLALVDMEFF
ncbi:MAG TPA: DUF58 domain-containing protein, partial [Ignisphaera sp.]|nr:DUF58 domain-containing protein [Ignisphaera sp.]